VIWGRGRLRRPSRKPWFGGKSKAAELIWERFGNTPNYVEPFAGSLAVLLARPYAPKTETVNDLDGLLSNAWRAIRADPDAVACHADQPVVEVDLHARHVALVTARADLTARLMADPDYYDARLAGWWIWGACNWIGSGWCSGEGPWVAVDGLLVHSKSLRESGGVSGKLPHLGDGGKGVSRQLPHLGNGGTGDTRPPVGVARQVPYLSSAGVGVSNPGANPMVLEWIRALSERLRRTRICCGSWDRVTGESVTVKHGLTAVLLDPPYDAEGAQNDVYGAAYDESVSGAAWRWAVENGDNPLLRIAFCGYGDDRELPPGWVAVPWNARKGYQKVKEDGTHNGQREMIWFSPHCLRPDDRGPLFGGL